MKTIYTFLFILLIPAVFAQQGNYRKDENSPKVGVISGRVVDKDLGTHLEYSNVAVYSMKDSSLIGGSIADDEGNFRVNELPFGRFYVVVNFIGFEKSTISNISIFPKQAEMDLGIIPLQSATKMLDEAVVTAERTQIEYHVDRKVINVSSNIMASGGNAVDVLETAPSIQVDVEGNVLLRGSSNFTVLIDGKPTILEPTDVLEQIPAGTIEDIEIITNPSAKYDPDGVGGIINVVLKKKKTKGTSGVVNAMVGTNHKFRTDFLINVQNGKFDFFVGGDYQDREFEMLEESRRISELNDTTIILDTNGEGRMERKGKAVTFGLGYSINENNKLSFSSRIGEYGFGRIRDSFQEELTTPPGETVFYDNLNSFRRDGEYYRLDLTWDHSFSNNTDLVTFFFYSGRKGENLDFQESSDVEQDGTMVGLDPYFTKTFENSESDQIRFKLDFTHEYKKGGVLEAGYQWRYDDDVENYFFYEKLDANIEWPAEPSFTNSTDYVRHIHGGYLTYESKTNIFEYKLGLRTEYTDRNLTNIGADQKSVLDRVDFFPSIHIGKELKENHEIYASYSRRINRPRGWYLDPFPYFRDPFTIRIGNPDLEPEYIDSYELGIIKEIKQSFISLEAYYRITNNMITRIQTLEDDGIFYVTFDNINRDFALGMELSWNFNLAEWASINLSGNLYNYRIDGIQEADQSDGSSTNVDGRFNASFKMGKNTRFQVNTILRGPTVTAQGDRNGMWAMNLSARQDLMKKRLTATLQVRDIFDTMNFNFTSKGENFTSDNFMDRESQIFMLTLSYKINNYRPDRGQGQNGGGFDEGM